MGEYAIRIDDREEIKIGTCECMYYLPYEKRHMVKPMSGQVNPHRDLNLFWRLPFPDEDDTPIGNYDQHNRGYPLVRQDEAGHMGWFTDPETVECPGIIQLTHKSGLLLNVACYHGVKLPEATHEIRPFWNGKSYSFELRFLKNTKDGVIPVVHCRHCEQMWSYSWDDILPWISDPEMKRRLQVYQR